MKQEAITIKAPNFLFLPVPIRGTAPYVQHKFSEKARRAITDKQKAGAVAKKGTKKDPRDFDAEYKAAMHVSTDGWHGIPAPAFRNAMISACRTVGFKMTIGKLSVFVEPDGFDDEGTPLVKITEGKPEPHEAYGRINNGMGTTVMVRPMWKKWAAVVTIKFDADQFSSADVANLMARAGGQVGVGEGRPDSKMSCGMGWGTFEIVMEK
jgi:hypothetical protein